MGDRIQINGTWYIKEEPTQDEEKKSNYLDVMIEEIIANFDFEKVHKVMTLLNWEWRNEGVPPPYKIIEEARRHLRQAAEYRIDSKLHHETACSSSSGGLKATAYCCDNRVNIEYLQLEFILTEWDAQYDY